jgi:hypothetical protein
VLDFSNRSGDAWYILNKKYKSGRGSIEYERAFDAFEEVTAIIRGIARDARKNASYGTKRSALVTIRKIGKSICLAPSTLGSEVRKHMGHDNALTDTMTAIMEGMNFDERVRMGEEDDGDGKGDFFSEVIELRNMAAGYCLFGDLGEAIDIMADPAQVDTDGEPYGDEDDEEDDD